MLLSNNLKVKKRGILKKIQEVTNNGGKVDYSLIKAYDKVVNNIRNKAIDNVNKKPVLKKIKSKKVLMTLYLKHRRQTLLLKDLLRII